ncbi:MAG: hypothetical protein EP297_01580 [Gammaproteobacteria bacterium]|nr:MAG: hypothetical protein EP297_01580 [Gammaproteobacteria bacterium]
MKKALGILAAVWGAMGAIGLLGFALWRLTPIAIETFQYDLSILHWFSLIAYVIFMAWSEGYKGFQQGYSPRVAARCLYLSQNPSPLLVLFAPVFTLGYFHATRRRLITSYVVTFVIIGLVVIIKLLDQPWRGIIDAGVVVGLAWGLVSFFYFFAVAFFTDDFPYSPEVKSSASHHRH